LAFYFTEHNYAQKDSEYRDDDLARELMGMALLKSGYQITLAENGVEGYETALSLKLDLIVAGIRMPSADGSHAVGLVSNTPTLEDTPIRRIVTKVIVSMTRGKLEEAIVRRYVIVRITDEDILIAYVGCHNGKAHQSS
jgi:CheY-like chemotaxis protein